MTFPIINIFITLRITKDEFADVSTTKQNNKLSQIQVIILMKHISVLLIKSDVTS